MHRQPGKIGDKQSKINAVRVEKWYMAEKKLLCCQAHLSGAHAMYEEWRDLIVSHL